MVTDPPGMPVEQHRPVGGALAGIEWDEVYREVFRQTAAAEIRSFFPNRDVAVGPGRSVAPPTVYSPEAVVC